MKHLLSIFRADKGSLSSKRVCGVLGWVVVLICYCYAVVADKEIPQMGELIAACVALLGIDSVGKIFTNNKDKEKDEED